MDLPVSNSNTAAHQFFWSRFASLLMLLTFVCASANFRPTLSHADDSIEASATPEEPISFSQQIKPILSDRCFLCHGPDQESEEAQKTWLRLDQEEEAAAVIEAGDPENSDLYLRIISDDRGEGGIMPPVHSNLSLNPQEIELIKKWIEQGAKFDKHWAFQKPETVDVPQAKSLPESASPVDQFVVARLEAEELSLADSVSKETLIRRVTFDLTGLPPTLAEVDAFITNESPDAYEHLVDRLLASTRYGERMAADWLDVARYSDTYGYQVDRDRFVWPWRDWVIRQFNNNLPYSTFIIEQLAGDLLPDATNDQILATTFNRLHPQKVEGGSIEEEFRVEYVADRAQTVATAFMGLTLECARCHTHKYDPITHTEYYQLFSFFGNIDEAGLYSYFDEGATPTPGLLLKTDEQEEELASLTVKAESLAEQTAAFADSRDGLFEKWLTSLSKSHPADAATIALVPGAVEKTAVTSVKLNRNKQIAGPNGTKAVKLTGDDELQFDVGKFTRSEPFSIALRIKVPKTPETTAADGTSKRIERAVILHRSKAWTDAASRGYQLLIENDRLNAALIHFWPGNAISVQTKQPLPVDRWLHVAMVYDGSSRADGLKIFIDGQRQSVDIVRDKLTRTIIGEKQEYFTIGARFRDRGFKNGEVADLNIFPRELAPAEVLQLHDGQTLAEALKESPAKLADDQRAMLKEYFLLAHDKTFEDLLKAVKKARAARNAYYDKLPEIMVMSELSQPKQAYRLNRGVYNERAEGVASNVPEFLPPLPELDEDRPYNRLDLARWLVAPNHPLTARVTVNRYWQMLFGEGFVRTPDDFGNQGQLPTHPELLDWLALDFQANGWDVKRLLKMLVMSKTYQQSTKADEDLLRRDPDNRLLARMSTIRLPAEMLRDNALAAGGLLVEKIGGKPVRPYELAVAFKPSKPDEGESLYRRSLYTYWKRTGPAPVMMTLDAAKRDVCKMKREQTSSPLQGIVLLNSPQFVEAARALGQALIDQYSGDAEIAANLFRTLTSRQPTARESKIVQELFERQFGYFNEQTAATKEYLSIGQSKPKNLSDARLAAWASTANALMSFDEVVTKR